MSKTALSLNRGYARYLPQTRRIPLSTPRKERRYSGLALSLALFVGFVLVFAWAWLRPPVSASHVTWTTVTVQPGDTLYGLISAHNHNADLNYLIYLTEKHQHIPSVLHPGQQLEIPVVKGSGR